MKKLLLSLVALLVTVGAWAQNFYSIGEATTTLTDGKYVLVAMSDKGTGPCYFSSSEGDGRCFRYDLDKNVQVGTNIEGAQYVWTIDETTTGGVQKITVTNVGDPTKAFPADATIGNNFKGTGTAELYPEVHNIGGVDYIALKYGNIGYIHANNPPGNPCLSYWTGYGDTGSSVKFRFYPVEEIDSEMGQVDKWKTTCLATIGYVGGYPESAIEEIEAVTTLDEISAFEASHEAITISTDTYYRIVCVAPKADNGDASYNTLTFNGASNLVTNPADNSNINQIFKFEDAGNGTYYLKNMNADGYLNKIAAGNFRSAIVEKNDACKLQIKPYGDAQWELHNSEATEADGQNYQRYSLFAENHSGETIPNACSGWELGINTASAWYIIPETNIKVVVNEYASIYLPFAVEVEGAQAYAIESANATHAVLTEKADIPAAQGAILAGNGTATLNFVAEAASVWTNNKLKGSTVNTYVDKDAYVLAKKDGVIGFYKAELNQLENTSFLNNANKAYLEVETADARFLSFDFGTETAIESVESVENNAIVYDLAGRRVKAAQKGLYIVNGKVVIK